MTANKRHHKSSFILCGLAVLLSAAVLAGCKKGDGSEETDGKSEGKKPDPVIHISLPSGQELVMVRVEAGTFEMSSKDGENDTNEVPHQVTLTQDFYLAQTEVTQAQWRAVMGEQTTRFKGDNQPAQYIGWDKAMKFCDKLNAGGIAPDGWLFSLPTETQWEYAARGGNKSKGYKYSGSNWPDEVAWYRGNADDMTHPVGMKMPNELGLYDMSGNVYEWCLDDWEKDSSKLTAEFARENYKLLGSGSGYRSEDYRAYRGGCYFSEKECRTRWRKDNYGNNAWDSNGFRVALVPDTWAKALQAEAAAAEAAVESAKAAE